VAGIAAAGASIVAGPAATVRTTGITGTAITGRADRS
jgi:hypothetical protein